MSEDKITLKQVEVSVTRFKDQAIPYYLGLLKNHRSNIEKSLALGDWSKIRKEEMSAMRVVKQIKSLLFEMEALRAKVHEADLKRFDELTAVGKQKAFEAMKEYTELKLTTSNNASNHMDDNLDDMTMDSNRNAQQHNGMGQQKMLPQIKADFQQQEHQLAQRQACLEELEHLQQEIRLLNSMFYNMRELVQEQSESVQVISENAEEALEQVQQGERQLRTALIYKKAMYPVVGALLGTCVGGPIGLVAGLKAGGLAAVGCGILGFTGGTVLKSSPAITQGNIEEVPSEHTEEEELELKHQNSNASFDK